MTEGRHTNSSYGDRAENQFNPEFGSVAREGYALFSGESIYGTNALVQLDLAECLGVKGENLLQWTVDGLKAYMKYGYMAATNQFRPMWADGTDLTGFVFPRFGYYGSAGKRLSPSPASLSIWLSYARAFRLTGDLQLWQLVRSIAKGRGLGDIGKKPTDKPCLNLGCAEADPIAIFGVLELYRAIPHPDYLDLARQLADHIIQQRFHHGFFLPVKNRIHASFNEIDPLTILAVEAALQNQLDKLPSYLASRGYIHGQYDGHGRTTDGQAIYSVVR